MVMVENRLSESRAMTSAAIRSGECLREIKVSRNIAFGGKLDDIPRDPIHVLELLPRGIKLVAGGVELPDRSRPCPRTIGKSP